MRGGRNLHAGSRDPPCGHVKLGDRPRGQDGKWPCIAVFSKISKRKPGDRPQRIDFEPHAAPRGFQTGFTGLTRLSLVGFLATESRRDRRAVILAAPRRGGYAPNGREFCQHRRRICLAMSKILCSTTYEVIMY